MTPTPDATLDQLVPDAERTSLRNAETTVRSLTARLRELEAKLDRQREVNAAPMVRSPLTLSEAIAHADAKGAGDSACAADHRQLASWLRELQAAKMRNTTRAADWLIEPDDAPPGPCPPLPFTEAPFAHMLRWEFLFDCCWPLGALPEPCSDPHLPLCNVPLAPR